MNRFRFSEVRVAIADSTEISAHTTRTILHNLGIRDFTVTRDIPQTHQDLDNGAFDLLVVNSHLGDEETAELINSVRHGDVGQDPFVPIIVLSWEPSVEVVSHFINAGADVLLSAERVLASLESLIEQRKPFLVTSNYIGPDRRHSSRAGSPQIQMTLVPNTLRRKALGVSDDLDPDQVRQSVFEQRVERYISRITFTVGKITGLTSGEGEGTFSAWRVDLKHAAENLSQRIRGTRYAQHSALCDTLIDLANAMAEKDTPSVDDLEVLQQIALALEIAIKEDDTHIIENMLDVERAVQSLKTA